MRNQFNHQLKELNLKILKMGAMVQEIIQKAMEALVSQNRALAQQVIEIDDAIDALELEIEMNCMNLIALQQPMAKDLRVIGTALKIITDLERMGDHAVNIAKTAMDIGQEPFIKPLVDLPQMAKLTQGMVKKSLDAFMALDVEKARAVAEDDEAVDQIYLKLYTELINKMIEEQAVIRQATHLLFIGRYLERIADHATNIGERVIYIVTGEKIEIN